MQPHPEHNPGPRYAVNPLEALEEEWAASAASAPQTVRALPALTCTGLQSVHAPVRQMLRP
ncbi:hypothetical protein [Streptomyces sp. NBC_00439]|uniref:hypothetical protein n=1 Tax=unclassified Streptomyces TaxID=2593676 RepID=UPI002250E851|nr:hypothetical protein [Streptomyces sp. NBC_00439]MCX5103618.1 hypothetical protein [Streptomyces sp. NBC_00439]WSX06233.1 hypothetical protein OG355_40615 [Streptomyces sp. NBC_00987]